jgi:raffinose/stachyose/melibiose transport system permease protein
MNAAIPAPHGRVGLFKLASLAVWLLALIVFLPLLNTIVSGFKTSQEINRSQLLPAAFRLDNFARVLSSPGILFSFINSAMVAVGSIVLTLLLCSVAAYGLARRKERVFSILYLLFLSAMIIPAVAALVPLYTMMRATGLIDNLLGLILIYSTGGIPFCVLLFSSFIKTVPTSLDEAAMLEGCSYVGRFYKVIFPLMKPVAVTFTVLQLPAIWNDFLMPLLFIRSRANRTITLAVYAFTREHETDTGAVFALLILALIPPVLLFVFAQRQLYRGIAAGAVKG